MHSVQNACPWKFSSNFNDIFQATDTEPKLNFRTIIWLRSTRKKNKEKKKCPTQHFQQPSRVIDQSTMSVVYHPSIPACSDPIIHPAQPSRNPRSHHSPDNTCIQQPNIQCLSPSFLLSIYPSHPLVLCRVRREAPPPSKTGWGAGLSLCHSNSSQSVLLDDSASESCDKAFSPLTRPHCATVVARGYPLHTRKS